MAMKYTISAALVRQFLQYDAETGKLTWKPRTPDMFPDDHPIMGPKGKCARWNKMYAGREAGGLNKGYVRIRVGKYRLPATSLIWLIVHGKLPDDQIDHRNGDRSANRLSNLREADDFCQAQNRKRRSTNRSGLTGVCQSGERWRAEIQIRYVRFNLGAFDTKEEAYAVYLEAKSRLHTFQPFPRE